MLTFSPFARLLDAVDCSPWGSVAGRSPRHDFLTGPAHRRPLYSVEERRRRDTSPWTMVQGVLAPVQFAVFLVSFYLVMHYLITGDGLILANASVIVKTVALLTIMVTGAVWEHEVFGRYLFAPAFFWEDVVSMGVIALHSAYVAALLTGALDPRSLMLLALTAYATYVVNAAQFVLKLRAARLDLGPWASANRHQAAGLSR